MGQKFNTMKRFGLEGCESFIPGLKASFGSAIKNGARNFIIGMPHRGRLNTLANVVRKPKEEIMAEFQGTIPEAMELTQNSGDVKYHLGTTLERDYGEGEDKTPIKITILANPSHLEAVNPVVHGRTRAEQHFFKEHKRDKVVPIIVHGDAAFAGQGIVYECLQMQDLPNYTVGGTIHVIVNNQVGFTTSPYMSRSGQYCTDVAKGIDAPIFHVNGDRVEDVSRTFAIAAEYRQKFNQDVIIDLIGYRKMGHNELDQPMFTQPMMYSIVSKKIPVRNIYRQQLLDEGIAEEELKAIESKYT
jgi:2-oxoglutarate dehydrogenase E1 component